MEGGPPGVNPPRGRRHRPSLLLARPGRYSRAPILPIHCAVYPGGPGAAVPEGPDVDQPAIKGSAFQSVVDDLRRLVDEGRVDLDEIDLSEKDRKYLDMITPVTWVPIACYDRLLQVLCRVEGGADPAGYLRKRGSRAAERLLEGSYESFKVATGSWGLRVAKSFVGISSMLYNFSRWSVAQADDEGIEFRVEDAQALPETALEAAQGFLAYFATLASGKAVDVTRTRGPGQITIRVRTR